LTNRLKSGKLKVKDYMNDLRQIIDSDAAKLEGTKDPKKKAQLKKRLDMIKDELSKL